MLVAVLVLLTTNTAILKSHKLLRKEIYMATLLTHLRIAERLSDQINIIDRSVFFVGSIAPDTEYPQIYPIGV